MLFNTISLEQDKMASSQIMGRLRAVNKVLTKVGVAGAILGGVPFSSTSGKTSAVSTSGKAPVRRGKGKKGHKKLMMNDEKIKGRKNELRRYVFDCYNVKAIDCFSDVQEEIAAHMGEAYENGRDFC